MHPSAYAFASTALAAADVAGKRVVEAGSYDYNGTVRPVYEPLAASYLGSDAQPGPGVDMVCPAEKLPAVLGAGVADVVITTEMLEHAEDWRAAMRGLAELLAPGGVLVLTARGPGFPYHPHPGDFWRFTPEVMDAILDALSLHVLRCEPDPDPDSPGVFAVARKPDPWGGIDGEWLDLIEAGPPR